MKLNARFFRFLAFTAAVSVLSLSAAAQDYENESPSDYIENSSDEDEFFDSSSEKESLYFITFANAAFPRDFMVSAGEVLCENLAVSLVSTYPTVNDADTTNDQYPILTLQQIAHNFTNPWTWDNSSFLKNQLYHPYFGSLYFIAGRSHDLNFAQSLLYTAAGSFIFESIFQSETPSLNDVITTTLSGAVVGEAIHRLSYDIGDLFFPLSWAVSPVDAISTAVSGQRALRPAGYMEHLDFFLGGGMNTTSATLSTAGEVTPSQQHIWGGGCNIKYGNQYGHNSWEAFDQFSLRGSYFTDLTHHWGDLFVDGMFYSISLLDDSPFQTTAGITMNYDLLHTSDFAFSASSAGGTYKMLLPILTGGIGFEVEADYILLGTMGDYFLMTDSTVETTDVSGQSDYLYCHGPQLRAAVTVWHPELFTINLYALGAFAMPYPGCSADDNFRGQSLIALGRGEIEKEFGLGIYLGASFNCYYKQTFHKNIQRVNQFDTFTTAYVKYVF